MNFIVLIFFLFLVTYIPRMLPAILMDKIKLSKKARLFLQLIPYTAMTALIFPSVFTIDTNIWVGIVGVIVAVLASLRGFPVVVVVVLSVLACLLVLL